MTWVTIAVFYLRPQKGATLNIPKHLEKIGVNSHELKIILARLNYVDQSFLVILIVALMILVVTGLMIGLISIEIDESSKAVAKVICLVLDMAFILMTKHIRNLRSGRTLETKYLYPFAFSDLRMGPYSFDNRNNIYHKT